MKTDGENITRVALITGAGSGLGETIAVRFAREGMEVGVLDINLEHAQSVAQRINVSAQ
jgi:NAD(P)-dependent dehydrogenase (short-subunit alcohol dehydrogenase family)